MNKISDSRLYTARELREMFLAATNWLERNASAVNALNVFPVPDGDTGTNMLLTMRATVQEVANLKEDNASAIAQAMYKGALMGARGNSGVILSQILRGIADGFGDKTCFGHVEMASAFEKAASFAYKAISKPVEGTMLTVIKDISETANRELTRNHADLISLMESVVEEARISVERTPELLEALREAGVVDAGGKGLFIIMEGILFYLRGEGDRIKSFDNGSTTVSLPSLVNVNLHNIRKREYGYCTEFIVRGVNLDADNIRRALENKGDSIVVAGDETIVKVHVHTPNPGAILELGILWGSLHELKIQNMDSQNEDFVEERGTSVSASPTSVVSVVAGKGLEKVFIDLGSAAIVSGGQNMNPSTQEILRAVQAVPSDKVIILPNNKNVILTAQQAAKLSNKLVNVLPTRSVPQGIAALVAFNGELEPETNITGMSKAIKRVRTIEITKAVRASRILRLNIKQGDFLGLVDGKIIFSDSNLWQIIFKTLEVAGVDEYEIITIYYGIDIKDEEAQSLGKALREKYSTLQVDVIEGSQSHYSYIISVE